MCSVRDTVVVKFIPAVKWYKRAKWELMEVYTSNNEEVNVPIGFITDGASIPFYARMWFSPTGRYFGAAIVHDYIIVTEHDWAKANYQFKKEIDVLDIKKWRKMLLIASVTSWGWFLQKIGKNSIHD